MDYSTAHRVNDETKESPFDLMLQYENRSEKKKKSLPNRIWRFCTRELKIRVTEWYLQSIGIKKGRYIKVMGIRYDEPDRWIKYKDDVMLPLKDAFVTKAKVFDFWKQQDFDLQIDSFEGNCDLCFHKGKYKKMLILHKNPSVATWWSKWEQTTKQRFDKINTVEYFLQKSKQPFDHKKAYEPSEIEKIFKTLILQFDDTTGCFCGD